MILPMSFKTAVKKVKRKPKLFEFKEFGSKSIDFIDNADAPINIQHGAIRSGKTISSIITWLDFIANHPYDEFMESGKTRTSLYRNVLRPQMSIMESLGIDYEYRPNDGYIRIEDNTVWLVGFAHEGIAEIIRGMTIAGWKADEVNTYSKNNVEEALDRLSIEGSRAFWDMNPDSPNHYVYKEYIINQSLRCWRY